MNIPKVIMFSCLVIISIASIVSVANINKENIELKSIIESMTEKEAELMTTYETQGDEYRAELLDLSFKNDKLMQAFILEKEKNARRCNKRSVKVYPQPTIPITSSEKNPLKATENELKRFGKKVDNELLQPAKDLVEGALEQLKKI